MQLNKSQALAKKEITKWLSHDEPELILSAPGGYGKSFLVDNIVADLPQFNKRRKLMGNGAINKHVLTATTNKAASVLNNGQTINKLFGLIPLTDYSTGSTYLKPKDPNLVISNTLIILDECSAASTELVLKVKAMTHDCKILYSGDHCQLLPVNEDTSPVFDSGTRQINLTEPMRQDPNSDLFKLCEQLRRTVETGVWEPMEAGDGITFAQADETKKVFDDWFSPDMKGTEAKAITYTNQRAIQLNKYVRTLCGYKPELGVNDLVAIRNFCFDLPGKVSTKIEEIHTITDLSTIVMDYKGLAYREVELSHGATFRLPDNHQEYLDAVKATARNKDWQNHFFLKENFIDLRSAYSCTGHVSQGSTYDKVFIDLENMSKCFDVKTLARLLYVAITRAKHEVVFNGRLPYKYRG